MAPSLKKSFENKDLEKATNKMIVAEFPADSPSSSLSGKKNDGSLDGSEEVEVIPPREHWNHHMDFILGCIGYAVGFGSIWRFPYLCMRNGGGAFLVPYIFFMFVCGVPLFFLELAIGQYAGASPLKLWEICPLFQGLGWSMLIVSGIVCIYYNIILTWILYYLVMSLNIDVPWRTCSNWWNTCNCFEDRNETVLNQTQSLLNNNCTENSTLMSASEEFWKFNTLNISESIDNLGPIRWQLLICLIVAWVMIFGCLCKGVKSVGKVVYVTATSPYVFLLILLIRNSLLEGSMIGVKFFLEPRWERLLDVSIWAEAALQVFFALGPSWGGLITMSSFNKFHNNCYRDAMIVPAVNCLTSIFGGFVIFTVIGHMSYTSGVAVEKTLEVGPGITFVAYPEAIAKLPYSPFWSILFFLMLITIGLDSQFGMFETMTSSFIDAFPRYLRPNKVLFTGFMCIIECILALPIVTRGGIYIFTILDWYVATFSLSLIAFLEIVVICYIYGIKRFREDICSMIGFKPSHLWTAMWLGVTPVTLILIFGSSIIMYERPTYGSYEFPNWAIAFGWCLGFSSLVPIPTVMIYKIITTKGSFLQRLRKLSKPAPGWGPTPELRNSGVNPEKSTNKLLISTTSV